MESVAGELKDTYVPKVVRSATAAKELSDRGMKNRPTTAPQYENGSTLEQDAVSGDGQLW